MTEQAKIRLLEELAVIEARLCAMNDTLEEGENDRPRRRVPARAVYPMARPLGRDDDEATQRLPVAVH